MNDNCITRRKKAALRALPENIQFQVLIWVDVRLEFYLAYHAAYCTVWVTTTSQTYSNILAKIFLMIELPNFLSSLPLSGLTDACLRRGFLHNAKIHTKFRRTINIKLKFCIPFYYSTKSQRHRKCK
jgi:hypothetical protein